VAAPSKLHRPRGDRVKTDAHARRLLVEPASRQALPGAWQDDAGSVADVAIARELAGWAWSLAMLE
jgi:hypothetical protein